MLPIQLLAYQQSALVDACGEDPGFLCELVFDMTDSEGLAEATDFFVRPVKVILIFLLAWLFNRVIRKIINRTIREIVENQEAKAEESHEIEDPSPHAQGRLEALRELTIRRSEKAKAKAERSQQRAQTLGTVLRSIASLVLYTIATFMALSEFNVNLGPLIASAGIIGIAFGFGAQSLVKDFLSGMFMLVEDQYGVGDIVDVGDAAGVVEEVKLRTTKIRDVHGTLWHIPNGEIRRVANKSQEWARAVLDVEVAYDTDINHAMSVIKSVADSVWEAAIPHATILDEPEIWGVEAFGASAIAIRLVVKVEPAEQWAAAREIRKRLKQAFDDEGIEIPFPQRTIWVNQVPLESAPATTPKTPVEEFEAKGAPEGEVST